MEFEGKVVAVTGAAGGIGQELCRHFAGEGAAIAALDWSETLDDFAATLRADGARIESAFADVGDAAAVEQAFARLTMALGPVDILVNNAGVSHASTLDTTSPDAWRRDVSLNVDGAYNCICAVLPEMKARRAGIIVNIGSVNGLLALGDPAYSAGKAGMISLTKSLAVEYGSFGIRANIVCPATVRTPIWKDRLAKDPDVLKRLARWYPLGRIVEPIEVMRAVAFLASDAASAITGVVLPVDCGLTAGNIVMARELVLEDL